MSELKQFKLPDVGEGLTEADIVRWLVQPAGAPAPPADISAPPAEGAVEPGIHGSPAPKVERQAVLVGYGVKLGATTRRARKPAGDSPASPARSAASPAGAASATRTAGASTTLSAASAVSPIRPAAEAATGGARTAVLAKPPVRKLAKDLGVDLAGLTGTGPSGSITRDDIQAAAVAVEAAAAGAGTGTEAAGDAAPAAPAGPAGPAQAAAIRLASLPREERIAIRGVRKHMAAAMTASAFTAPHVTEFLQIDITETIAATARLRPLPEFEGVRVSPLVLVAKALLVAAGRHPMVNSSWDEAAQEIVVKHYVNLGVAAATDRGLLVPSVKDAHALSLPGLARAIGDLTETARAGKSTPGDLRGGTVTITNVGVFGVDT